MKDIEVCSYPSLEEAAAEQAVLSAQGIPSRISPATETRRPVDLLVPVEHLRAATEALSEYHRLHPRAQSTESSCEHCRQNAADQHITVFQNEERLELNLCYDCYKKWAPPTQDS